MQVYRFSPLAALAVVCTALLMLSGCASTMGSYFGRAQGRFVLTGHRVNNQSNDISVLAVTADRRVVLYRQENSFICSEQSPDAGTELGASTEGALKAGGEFLKGDVHGSFGDAFALATLAMAQRTPALDAFRFALYNLCQLRMNKVLGDKEVGDIFVRLIEKFPWEQPPASAFVNVPAPSKDSTSPSSSGQSPPATAPALPTAPRQPVKPAVPSLSK